MTVDELWENLQPYMKKVDNLESEMHEVKGTVTNLQTEMHEVKGTVANLENSMHKLETEMHEVKDTVNNLESNMHIVKDVNMTTMLKRQEEIRDELKQEIRGMGEKITSRIDQYIQKHEVEHKRIEYQIADLEWKNRIAN